MIRRGREALREGERGRTVFDINFYTTLRGGDMVACITEYSLLQHHVQLLNQ